MWLPPCSKRGQSVVATPHPEVARLSAPYSAGTVQSGGFSGITANGSREDMANNQTDHQRQNLFRQEKFDAVREMFSMARADADHRVIQNPAWSVCLLVTVRVECVFNWKELRSGLGSVRPNDIRMDRRGFINGLPKPVPGGDRRSARDKGTRYIRRLFHFQQMDFQFAIWQMAYLFYSPQKVFRNFQYRKQTKDQFARDDPAFLVLLLVWMIVSCVAFVVLLGIHFWGFFKFLLWTIFIDCVGIGLVVATVVWIICNKYLIKPSCRYTEDVEWGYCFDVHLNAFFPALIILHLFQLFFYHVVIRYDNFLGRFIGDTLFLIACAYYVYITFLGYSALPILKNTKVFLYPMAALLVLYVMSLTAGFNMCRMLVDFYHYRVM